MKKTFPSKKIAAPLLLAFLAGASPFAGADNSVAYELELKPTPQPLEQPSRNPADVSRATPEPGKQLTVKRRQPATGSVQRQRKPALSADQLLIISYDSQGEEVYRTAIHDPRVVRAEFLGDDQQNTESTRVIRTNALLNFTLPDDPSIYRIDILQPSWADGRMQLQTIGSVMQE